ncbi:Tetraspanin-3, partial [Mucuna pruriens]
MRGKNLMMSLINLLSFLVSIPILGGGIWLSTRANNTECLKFLQWPLIIIAVCIMLTSFVGLTGSCYRNTFLMSLYLVVMFFIMLVLLGFIIFAYSVTNNGSGRVIQNRVYLEYYLQDYSGWLKKRVAKDSYWGKISFCLKDSNVCAKLARAFDGVPETAQMFYHRKLTPIQSGCCKPPAECGYTYENETVWGPGGGGGGGMVGSNRDCNRWSNEQHVLCYDCDSCKAGVIANIDKSWRKVSLINVIVWIALFIFNVIAYAAHRNNRDINNCQPCGETRMTKARPT